MFEEYPKISYLDMKKSFTRELMIHSFRGNIISSYYDIYFNINMVSSEGIQNELEVRVCFHCHVSISLLYYLPLTAFLKLASTF